MSRGWRYVIGIAGHGVWVAPCHSDCWAWRRLGGAVFFGLLGTASSGGAVSLGLLSKGFCVRRCVIMLDGDRVVWAALCGWDCQGGRCLGGAKLLGLLGRASSGWVCVVGIAGEGVIWLVLCYWEWWLRRRLGGGVLLELVVVCGFVWFVMSLKWWRPSFRWCYWGTMVRSPRRLVRTCSWRMLP